MNYGQTVTNPLSSLTLDMKGRITAASYNCGPVSAGCQSHDSTWQKVDRIEKAVEALAVKCGQIEAAVQEIADAIKYMPGLQEAKEAQQHFEQLLGSTPTEEARLARLEQKFEDFSDRNETLEEHILTHSCTTPVISTSTNVIRIEDPLFPLFV